MNIKDKRIDGGNAFDWGRTSKEYAKFRDIYPDEFYKRITETACVLKVRACSILERERVLFREICKNSEQPGVRRIYLKIR